MRYSTITQIGTFTAFDPSATDYLYLDPERCTGGADAPLRTIVEDAPGQDAGLIFPPLDGPQVITLVGDLTIQSAGDDSGYFAALDTLLASLKAAINALKAAPDDLVHSGGTLSVWKNAPVETSWAGNVMTVTFGLIVDVGL